MGLDGDPAEGASAEQAPDGSGDTGHKQAAHDLVALLEISESVRRSTQTLLQTLGYRVAVEARDSHFTSPWKRGPAPGIALLALPENRTVAKELRALPSPPVIIASMAGPAQTASQRFASLGADLFTLRPHSLEVLGPILHAARALLAQRQQAMELRSLSQGLRRQLGQVGFSGEVTGLQHFEYFKRLLMVELKRAKRFNYSVAVCLISPRAALPGTIPAEETRRKLRHKAASAVVSAIRDIDVAVDYSVEEMLIYLPHTDEAGAREVAHRVAKEVRNKAHTKEGDRVVRVEVAYGVAALKPSDSFARLLKRAAADLKKDSA